MGVTKNSTTPTTKGFSTYTLLTHTYFKPPYKCISEFDLHTFLHTFCSYSFSYKACHFLLRNQLRISADEIEILRPSPQFFLILKVSSKSSHSASTSSPESNLNEISSRILSPDGSA